MTTVNEKRWSAVLFVGIVLFSMLFVGVTSHREFNKTYHCTFERLPGMYMVMKTELQKRNTLIEVTQEKTGRVMLLNRSGLKECWRDAE